MIDMHVHFFPAAVFRAIYAEQLLAAGEESK